MADGFLGASDGSDGLNALASDIGGAFERGGDVADVQGIAVQVWVAAIGTRGGLHAHEGGGSHLPARHAVNGVVDENDRDVLPAVQGVDGLGRADAGEVAVALVGEHETVGPEALAGCGQRGSPAVRGLFPVDVEIPVGEDGTPDGADANGAFFHAHLFDHFGHELVHDAVRAAGTIVHGLFVHQGRLGVDEVLRPYDVFSCHIFV